MARWNGFAEMRLPTENGRHLRVVADYAGTDDAPIPLAVIIQRSAGGGLIGGDIVQLTEADLRWLVDEVAPKVLARMQERP
jgi:hypothetical protein